VTIPNGPVQARARHDAVVVGGGVIGLSIAWQAARRGLRTVVVDPAPGGGASYVAAGMLAPVMELQYGEQELLRLSLTSAQRYPSFVAELERDSGRSAGYRTCGTLAIALDSDDRALLTELHAFQSSLGLPSQWLTSRECRRLEPMLAPAIRGGLHVEGDHQIDNRMLTLALLAAGERRGVDLVRQQAAELVVEHGTAAGVRLADGTVMRAASIVLAAGCWSGSLAGLPQEVTPPVRPVKGQILRLQVPEAYAPFLSRNVRGVVKGSDVYLVPRIHGELVVGATTEEMGYDTQVTAGGVYQLLRDARDLVPGISELPLVESRAGLRPGSPDNAPMIGPSALPGLMVATGHYRHGMLLTPVTADAVAEALVTGAVPAVAQPFSPGRFAGAGGEEAARHVQPEPLQQEQVRPSQEVSR
jgi:glycine oxidase